MIKTFGQCPKAPEPQREPGEDEDISDEWECLGQLEEVMTAAEAGDPAAIEILKALDQWRPTPIDSKPG